MNEKGRKLVQEIFGEEARKIPVVNQDPWRLKFHLMPPTGWLNDPNGLCQADGVYHVFFQYSPFDAGGGEKFWGHYTSTNLRDWEYRGAPLAPDEAFDKDGVYSGSAFVEEKKIYLFYTGNVKQPGGHDYVMSGREGNTILVESEDGIHFGEKQLLMTNEDYPSDYTCHIRDPKVFEKDGLYYMVLGGRKKGDSGAVLLYESADLKSWTMKTELKVSGQFGYMWECPDLFFIGKNAFLSLSPQGVPRGKYEFQNVYSSGYFRIEGDFRNGCKLIGYEEWDKGFDFYAPQSFQDETGRRILIGWCGLPDIDKEYENPTVQKGWQHALTVPREITEKDGRLCQYPVSELNHLRRKEKDVIPGKETTLSAAFDLKLSLQEGCDDLKVTIAGGLHFTYDGREAVLSFDDSRDREGNFSGIGRGRDMRKTLIAGLKEVRILADTSLVELYLNHGEKVFTTRYYPGGSTRSLLAEGKIRETACWEMGAMQVRHRAAQNAE